MIIVDPTKFCTSNAFGGTLQAFCAVAGPGKHTILPDTACLIFSLDDPGACSIIFWSGSDCNDESWMPSAAIGSVEGNPFYCLCCLKHSSESQFCLPLVTSSQMATKIQSDIVSVVVVVVVVTLCP